MVKPTRLSPDDSQANEAGGLLSPTLSCRGRRGRSPGPQFRPSKFVICHLSFAIPLRSAASPKLTPPSSFYRMPLLMEECLSKRWRARSLPPFSGLPYRSGKRQFFRFILAACLAVVIFVRLPPGLGAQTNQAPKSSEPPSELKLAAASDLKFALDDMILAFQARHPAIRVKPSYGSSGNFFAMIQNKAPFDLFLSADLQYPQKLAESDFGLDTAVFLYAIGRLVVWVPTNSEIEVEQLGRRALLAPSIRKIAIANPRHAPYGRAAVAAMKSLGVYERAQSKLVFGENVTQAMQFTQSGAADIGLIALSLAASPPMKGQGRSWQVPLEAYPKMEQGGLILKWARNPQAARIFRDFILSEPGRDILRNYGFHIPEE